ncbi:M12 family metallo-peptidase [Massilia sp. SM-13]|uniref:M12 family metallo-peptidase n=1 Tax=Pseudoduganella rhizocola TaxID=3382643 RepID=UPI0038B48448
MDKAGSVFWVALLGYSCSAFSQDFSYKVSIPALKAGFPAISNAPSKLLEQLAIPALKTGELQRPISGVSMDGDDLALLRQKHNALPLKSFALASHESASYPEKLVLQFRRDELQKSVNWFLEKKRQPVTINGITLKNVAQGGAASIEAIINDKSVKTAKLLNVDLSRINLAKLFGKPIKLCDGDDDLCGEARTTGWVDDKSSKQMLVNVSREGQPGQILLVQTGATVSGIANLGGETKLIRHIGDDAYVLTSGTRSMDRNLNDVWSAKPQAAAPGGVGTAAPEDIVFAHDSDCPNPAETQVLDIVVAHTENANTEAKLKGYDLSSLIYTAEAIANVSFAQSKINGRFSIKEIVALDYEESPQFETDIDELTRTAGRLNVVNEAKARNQADVVVLVVHNEDPLQCGLAAEIGAKAENAYVVVNWQCMTDRYSFVHEIAHLAGAWHDPRTVGPDYQISPSYAAGYITEGKKPVATIMAYTASCPQLCGRGWYWSNPFVTTPDGQALGTKGKNFDACVWRKRFPVMARFGK